MNVGDDSQMSFSLYRGMSNPDPQESSVITKTHAHQ